MKLVSGLKLFSLLANIGDTRSLVIHPASTTHRQLQDEERRRPGAGPDVVRLSIGIEDIEDIIADLDQGLAAAETSAGKGAMNHQLVLQFQGDDDDTLDKVIALEDHLIEALERLDHGRGRRP